MRKISMLILALLVSVAFITGCTVKRPVSDADKGTNNNGIVNDSVKDEKKDETKGNADSHSVKDYYPFKENVKYEYTGTGMEYASYNTWVDYIKGDRIQLRINNGGTEIVRVLERKDGELRIVFTSPEETYYREDFTSRQSDKIEVLLMEPLLQGTTWELPDGRKRTITKTDVDITTALGSFKALEVTTEGKDYTMLDYYAIGKGLVKTTFRSNGSEVVSALDKIHENSPLVQNVKFYYPDINANEIKSEIRSLSFTTNDITKMAFEKAFKEPPKAELVKLLGPNAKIKSMYLNKDQMVYMDFTKELITEMNLGSGPEEMIMRSIVNTVGEYYGVQKVYVTVENEPYQSGHIKKKKGEPF
jgi:hypothetical protein